MADDLTERAIEIRTSTPIETASTVIANPDHPQYSADKAVAKELANGRTAIIAAIDGVGSGAETSKKAAEAVQKHLISLESSIITTPTINQAVNLLKDEILKASEEIQELQRKSSNEDVDTTVSAGILSESKDGKKRFITIANVGDSRLYKYTPSSGEVSQLTKDQSLVQLLVDSGQISQDEAFTNPSRNIILKTVGSLKSPNDIDFSVSEANNGDVFIAVSDGVSDNLTPEGFPAALRDEFQKSYDKSQGKIDLKKFSKGIAQRATNVMSTQSEHAKNDDVTVSVLRIPRSAK